MATLPTSEQHATISYFELDSSSPTTDARGIEDPIPVEHRTDTIDFYNSDSIPHHFELCYCDPFNNARTAQPFTVPAASGGNPGTYTLQVQKALPPLWVVKIHLVEAINDPETVRGFI